MKKLVLISMSIAILISAVGCSNQPAKESQTGEPTATATVSGNDSQTKYADMIPDPKGIFTGGSITVTDPDGGKAYIFNVKDYKDGEYETYTAECKKSGFDDVKYETTNEKGKDFGAYTADGKYWVQVNLDKSKDTIYVTCQESKKK